MHTYIQSPTFFCTQLTVSRQHDRPVPPIHLPKATLLLRTEERTHDRRAFFSEFKKSGFNLEPHGKDEPAITLYACYACGLKTKDHDDLKKCGRCHLVRYCSRSYRFLRVASHIAKNIHCSECQKKDWSSHKKFCGQERFDPTLLTPTPEADDSFIGCPTTVEGFRRPPALWRQIRTLSHNDSLLQDYHVGLIVLNFTSSQTDSLSSFMRRPGAPYLCVSLIPLVVRQRRLPIYNEHIIHSSHI